MSARWPAGATEVLPVICHFYFPGTLIHGKFSKAEIVRMEVSVPGETHPWKSIAGTWQGHPDAADFERNLKEYKTSVDSDPGRP